MLWLIITIVVALIGLAAYDLTQTRHAILRNFPVLGHCRYLIERIGPELRQYIVARNDEERPFSRDERTWVYATSKKQNSYFGFGSDNDMELEPNYLIIKHNTFPLLSPHKGQPEYDPLYRIPCAKIVGESRGRAKAFRPQSVVNISGMSFGSLSSVAVEALNKGCAIAGCLQSTGEGSIAPYHMHGGGLIWQVGTGYFGCRTPSGDFSMEKLLETIERHPTVKAVEIKLSHGAKPGAGGILPKSKITPEIAKIRGIPMDQDCVSPASHSMFSDADSLLDFAESIAEKTGMPVGIKSAVGETDFWQDLARHMQSRDRGVDFITIDGGEGGTGAGPLVFGDHVALPFKLGFARVRQIFSESGLGDDVAFFGAGKLGFPESALFAFALGCDMINVA
ncbi:MAG: FMN-binding glutamate synthase family protein, partial [Planctomycetota bacterium]